MTDKEIKEALAPLEDKMIQYASTSSVMLTHNDIKLMKEVYPHCNKIAGGQLPTVFNTGCSSCIKQVLSYYISFYFRAKEDIVSDDIIEPVASNEVIKRYGGG